MIWRKASFLREPFSMAKHVISADPCPDMEKLPIVICVDVEPEERAIEPKVASDWLGFEKTFEFFEQLRPHLEDVTGTAAHFSWFVRMDPQIAQAYGGPAWSVARYGRLLDRLSASGDEIGLHIHAWRWDQAFGNWIADMGNQEWVDSCVRMGFEAFEQSLRRPCLSFRFGDHWMNNATLDLVERLGARFDLTVEPGRKKLLNTEPYTGIPPDYSLTPSQPYRPSKTNFTEGSDSTARQLWVVPLSTFDPDRVLSFLQANGKEDRQPTFLQKLKRWSAANGNGYEGFLDRVDYEAIGGWAYDVRQCDRPLDIEIYRGEVKLARVRADGLRRDLLLAGKGNGRHSFILPTPSCLRDGKPHSIRARVANSRFELNYSPSIMKRDQPALIEPGVLLFDLCGEPWLASRMMGLAFSSPGKRYLAISLRSHEILSHRHLANLNENFASIFTHRMVKDFVFETPAELVARME